MNTQKKCNKGAILILLIAGVTFLLPVITEARTLFLQTSQQGTAQGEGAGRQVEAAIIKAPSVTYPVQSFRLKYIGAKELSESIMGLMGEGEGASVNEKINTVIVRASEKNLKRITELVEKLDVPPLQVQVEARIISLKSGSGDTNNPSVLGMGWKYTNSRNANDYIQLITDASTTAATSVGLYAQLLSGNVNAYLEALERTIGYNLVASPWLTALNHEEASILIGSKYGYRTTFTSTTGTMQNINFLEVGTKLRFIPHITEDGYIVMEIYPSVSDGSVKNDIPQEDTTETRNKVLVKDGQSILIGGLTKNYTSQVDIGVPILSSIPFIGSLFRRTEILSQKMELMVIITPHIVTPQFIEAMAQRAKDMDTQRQQWNEKAKLVR